MEDFINAFRLKTREILVRCESTWELVASAERNVNHGLSASEHALLDGFGATKRRHEYIASRYLAKQTLAEFTGSPFEDWSIERRATGAASLLRSGQSVAGPHISLSHSNGLCAVAVSGSEVGIDLQFNESRARWTSIDSLVFSSEEVELIRALPASEQSTAYSEIWALKEAFGKFRGIGLQIRAARNYSFAKASNLAKPVSAVTIQIDAHTLAIFGVRVNELVQQHCENKQAMKAWVVSN